MYMKTCRIGKSIGPQYMERFWCIYVLIGLMVLSAVARGPAGSLPGGTRAQGGRHRAQSGANAREPYMVIYIYICIGILYNIPIYRYII